ncbi:hypothetical protein PO124_07770 [Bacillus licheniformis]|nr:hypothetical protein [Bacillus licheniformis]
MHHLINRQRKRLPGIYENGNRIEEMETRVNSYAELSASSSSPFGRLEYAKKWKKSWKNEG